VKNFNGPGCSFQARMMVRPIRTGRPLSEPPKYKPQTFCAVGQYNGLCPKHVKSQVDKP